MFTLPRGAAVALNMQSNAEPTIAPFGPTVSVTGCTPAAVPANPG